jgi:hypothetical protein
MVGDKVTSELTIESLTRELFQFKPFYMELTYKPLKI